MGNISKRDEMPLNIMLEVEPFDCWGIDFMGPSPNRIHIFIFLYALLPNGWKQLHTALMMPRPLLTF